MVDMNTGYENSIVCIGDKGRSQLVRIYGDEIALAITDTQKATICFSQVQIVFVFFNIKNTSITRPLELFLCE